jgi:hypothetical protein
VKLEERGEWRDEGLDKMGNSDKVERGGFLTGVKHLLERPG